MDLHDFLAGSLELLTLLEAIEERREAIVESIARLDALSPGDGMRSLLFVQLREDQRVASAALARAIELLESF
jgi:hypothetical protein